jgi:hypothetical protein
MEALAVFNPTPLETPTMAKKADAPTMKKRPAVQEAVNALGVEAPVETVRKWVKEKFNLDLTDSVAQNYTSLARKALRAGGTSNGSVPAVPAAPKKRGPKPAAASAGFDVVAAVTTLQELTDKLGKDTIAKLVAAM